jgi:hypothetical protein
MPRRNVEPEVAFEVKDRAGGHWFIYHTYKNNDFDQGRHRFWYTTDVSESDEELEFDIRPVEQLVEREAGELSRRERYPLYEDTPDRIVLQKALDLGLASFTDNGELVLKNTTRAQRA